MNKPPAPSRENEIRLDHRAFSSRGGLRFAMKFLSLSLSTDEWILVYTYTRFHEEKETERRSTTRLSVWFTRVYGSLSASFKTFKTSIPAEGV